MDRRGRLTRRCHWKDISGYPVLSFPFRKVKFALYVDCLCWGLVCPPRCKSEVLQENLVHGNYEKANMLRANYRAGAISSGTAACD